MSIATLKSDLSLHNLTFEDAIELALCVSAKSANAVETIGSKLSYALTWCMPNNDDDGTQKNPVSFLGYVPGSLNPV